jgi:dipeptidyl aminopeptidase/acylaminoacyl peptidase
MRRRLSALVAAAALCVASFSITAMAAGSATPLIPRAVLFGNPERAGAQLSADGKWLAWLAPKDGVLNVWVAPLDKPAQARVLTDEKTRPVGSYFWSPDSTMILYVTDKDGDENFLLYGVDVASGARRSLTPFQKVRIKVVQTSRNVPGRILIGVNNRDPRYHDVYSLDLKTGKLSLVFENTGQFAGFIADYNLDLRIAAKTRADAGTDYYWMTGGKVADKPFESIDYTDSTNTSPHSFSRDGKILYWTDSRGRNTAVLIGQDVASGKKTILAQDARSDIAGSTSDPKTRKVDAYVVDYLKNEWHALDPALAPDFAFLQAHLKGQYFIASRTEADDKWLIGVDPVIEPPAQYLYDRKAKTLTQLYVTYPALVGAPLAAMHPLEIKARDGLTLVSYLTLPVGSDPHGTGRPEHPLPLVLDVHGGPHARDEYGYNPEYQWLANRGYAVLAVNYRGSTGFGKSFFTAGNHQWAAKMQDDLDDAVDWTVHQGIADPKKVAIFGGSYGGYATLVGLAFTPDRYVCGVDLVGPSNLETLLASIPPYWESGRAELYRDIGNPATPEGKALLKARSPLFKANAIKVPLLIGSGAHDPRVNVKESDQIAAALKARNIPVTYLVFPDEGHGFHRPENNIAFSAVAEAFLSHCVGGRAEPIGNAIKASTAVVKMGADYVPGLAQAEAKTPVGTNRGSGTK